MRKRVAENGGGVDAYVGDVEGESKQESRLISDHILLLQNSLQHYEYILSHCQPAYISHLNLGFKIAKGRSDKAILALSTVAIGVLPMQLVVSEYTIYRVFLVSWTAGFGMNVHVPHNGDPDNGHLETDGSTAPLNWFAGITVFLFFVTCGVVFTVRWWRWVARVKWAKLRGESVPSTWDGFWGLR